MYELYSFFKVKVFDPKSAQYPEACYEETLRACDEERAIFLARVVYARSRKRLLEFDDITAEIVKYEEGL